MPSEVQRDLLKLFSGALLIVAAMTGWMVAGSAGLVSYTWLHLFLYGIACILVSAWLLRRVQDQSIPVHWILISAVALRLLCLLGEPLFEDDHYRYLWDGLLVASGESPYDLPPAIWFDQALPPVWEVVLSRVSYPDVGAVYGPAQQWLFGAAAWLAPGDVWPLQFIAALADCAILFLLAYLSRGNNQNLLLLYAWSPLLLKEFALTAHPDVTAIAVVMIALVCRRKGMLVIAGALVGLATGLKVFSILVLPFLALPDPRRRGLVPNSLLTGGGFLIAIAAITIAWGTPDVWYPEGLGTMAATWLFNSPLPILLLSVTEFGTAKLILLCSFVVCYSVIWWQARVAGRGLQLSHLALVYVLFLIATPVINPWYFGWVLAFAVARPARWPWVASVVLLVSYATGYGTGVVPGNEYQLPVWLILAEFALIAIAATIDWRRPLDQQRPGQLWLSERR